MTLCSLNLHKWSPLGYGVVRCQSCRLVRAYRYREAIR
jgi:hypothetical protein